MRDSAPPAVPRSRVCLRSRRQPRRGWSRAPDAEPSSGLTKSSALRVALRWEQGSRRLRRPCRPRRLLLPPQVSSSAQGAEQSFSRTNDSAPLAALRSRAPNRSRRLYRLLRARRHPRPQPNRPNHPRPARRERIVCAADSRCRKAHASAPAERLLMFHLHRSICLRCRLRPRPPRRVSTPKRRRNRSRWLRRW